MRLFALCLLVAASCASLTAQPERDPCSAPGAGRALLGLQLTPDGRVEKAWVLERGRPEFDEAAVKAARRARFKPPAPKFLQYLVCFTPEAPDAGSPESASRSSPGRSP